MGAKLYNLDGDSANRMYEKEYDKEKELQKIIADNPDILLRQISEDEEEPKLYLIAREQNLDNKALDHLMVDANGVPALVEVKRSSDHRIYREVAAQLLDYASRISSLNVDDLKAQFEKNNPSTVYEDDNLPDPDDFWDIVGKNLKAENVKLIFAADKIPDSLRIIIEFMDRTMPHIDVYGVEIHQYKSEGATLLSTEYIGDVLSMDTKMERKKGNWDKESFEEFLKQKNTEEFIPVLESLLDVAKELNLTPVYGIGPTHPTVLLKERGITLLEVGIQKKTYVTVPIDALSQKLNVKREQIEEFLPQISGRKNNVRDITYNSMTKEQIPEITDMVKTLTKFVKEYRNAEE